MRKQQTNNFQYAKMPSRVVAATLSQRFLSFLTLVAARHSSGSWNTRGGEVWIPGRGLAALPGMTKTGTRSVFRVLCTQ